MFEDLAAANGLAVDVLGSLKRLGHHSGVQAQDEQVMLAFRRAA